MSVKCQGLAPKIILYPVADLIGARTLVRTVLKDGLPQWGRKYLIFRLSNKFLDPPLVFVHILVYFCDIYISYGVIVLNFMVSRMSHNPPLVKLTENYFVVLV